MTLMTRTQHQHIACPHARLSTVSRLFNYAMPALNNLLYATLSTRNTSKASAWTDRTDNLSPSMSPLVSVRSRLNHPLFHSDSAFTHIYR